MTQSRFAEDDPEAERRFNEFRSKDPFPSIPPALLNSADIVDYVAATGMICPFEENEERLKSASYRIDLLGYCVFWDEKGNKKSFTLERGKELVLKPNSIVFVTVEPMFRIPDYMALRFNLRISHVYKGLLVGTGPLVDPGFIGKLSLPLHNLTANEYTLKGGDSIIWMEFTKLSPNDRWRNDTNLSTRFGVYKGFSPEKNKLTNIDDYLYKAVGLDVKVRSSIPYAIEEASQKSLEAAESALSAKSDSEKARKDVEEVKNRVTVASVIVTLFIILGSYFGIILPSYNLVKTTTDNLVKTELDLKDLKDIRVKELEKQIDELQKRIVELENKLSKSYTIPSRSGSTSKPSRKSGP